MRRKKPVLTKLLNVVVALGACCTVCPHANAETVPVTLNTAQLVGDPAGPFSIIFVLTDGSGIGDTNNTVTIGNMSFGGGSALGTPILLGGASGSVQTGVTITDSSLVSMFIQQFAPGNQLSFALDLTLNG